MKRLFHKFTFILAASMTLWLLVVAPVAAQNQNTNFDGGLGEVGEQTALGTNDVTDVVYNIINITLSVLGIIAVVIIIYGGFLWFTSAGNPNQVAKAKQVLYAAGIGLFIVMAAFGITQFIFRVLVDATGTGSGGTTDPGGDDVPPPIVIDRNSQINLVLGTTVPMAGADNVPLCTQVQAVVLLEGGEVDIAFDVAEVADHVDWFLVDGSGNVIREISFIPRVQNNLLALVPAVTETLVAGTYEIQIDGGEEGFTAFDLAKPDEEYYFFEDTSWTFDTGNTNYEAGPNVLNTVPAPDEVNVCRAKTVGVVFDQMMDLFSLDARDSFGVRIDPGETGLPQEFETTWDKNYPDAYSMTAVHADLFEPNIGYQAGLDGTDTIRPDESVVQNICGIPLGAASVEDTGVDYVWSFTTGEQDQCVATITSVTESAYYSDRIVIEGSDFGVTGNVLFNNDVYATPERALPDGNVIPGSNLCLNKGSNFLPTAACVGSWTDTRVEIDLPAAGGISNGAIDGLVSIIAGNVAQGTNLDVLSPHISEISPQSAGREQFVTIVGTDFGARNEFSALRLVNTVGEVVNIELSSLACGEDAWHEGVIVFDVPETLASGEWRVQIRAGRDSGWSNVRTLIVTDEVPGPGLCPFGVESVEQETEQVLIGQNFGETQGDNEQNFVSFGGVSSGTSLAWGENQIRTVVPAFDFAEDALLSVQVVRGDQRSNFVPLTILAAPLIPPDIVSLSTDQLPVDGVQLGPVQQYVTITGTDFGDEAGQVFFVSSTGVEIPADINFPSVCGVTEYWTDSQIQVKLPAWSEWVNEAAYSVKIITPEDGLENDWAGDAQAQFSYTDQVPLGPGICNYDPHGGPVGTRVNFWGERLSNMGNVEWSTVGGFLSGEGIVWGDEEILSSVEAGVPSLDEGQPDAISGPVYVLDQNNIQSNALGFQVGDCRLPANDPNSVECASGTQCCFDGTCSLSCDAAPNPQFYGWTFTTGEIFEAFSVVEDQCDPAVGDYVQYPTPRNNQQRVCIDAAVVVKFNKSLITDTVGLDAFQIEYFNSESGQYEDQLPVWAAAGRDTSGWLQIGSNEESIRFEATDEESLWDRNTRYRFTVFAPNSDQSNAFVQSDGDDDLPNTDDDEALGEDYVITFQTQDSDEPCAIEQAIIEPDEIQFQQDENLSSYTPEEAEVLGFTSQCLAVGNDVLGSFAWSWFDSINPPAGRENLGEPGDHGFYSFFGNGRSELSHWNDYVLDEALAGNTTGEQAIYSQTDSTGDGEQDLLALPTEVTILECQTSDDCQACGAGVSSCVEGLCTPVVTNVTPDQGPIGSVVSVEGCYFGNRSNPNDSFVVIHDDADTFDFDSVEQRVADYNVDACGSQELWTDTLIQLEIPSRENFDFADELWLGVQAGSVEHRSGAPRRGFDIGLCGDIGDASAMPVLCSLNPALRDGTGRQVVNARLDFFGQALNQLARGAGTFLYFSTSRTGEISLNANFNDEDFTNVWQNVPLETQSGYVGSSIVSGGFECRSNRLPFIKAPAVTEVSPTNGISTFDARTYVTLSGSSFGDRMGRVEFRPSVVPNGAGWTTEDWLLANLAPCDGTWTDSQIVVETPMMQLTQISETEPILPTENFTVDIRIITAEGEIIQLDDAFQVNQLVRPNLCSLSPRFGGPGTGISLIGDRLGEDIQTIIWEAYDTWPGSESIPLQTLNIPADGDGIVSGWSNTGVSFTSPSISNKFNEVAVALTDALYDESELGFDINNDGAISAPGFLVSPVSNKLDFIAPPRITRVTPESGPKGTWLTIEGENLGEMAGEIYLDNQRLEPIDVCFENVTGWTDWSDTRIQRKIPEDAVLDDNNQEYWLVLERADGVQIDPLNVPADEAFSTQFTLNQELLPAGLCELQPELGRGGDNLEIVGESFLPESGTLPLSLVDEERRRVQWVGSRVQFATTEIGTEASVDATGTRLTGMTTPAFELGQYPVSYQKNIIEEEQQCVGLRIGNTCIGVWRWREVQNYSVDSNALDFNISDFFISNVEPADDQSLCPDNTTFRVEFSAPLLGETEAEKLSVWRGGQNVVGAKAVSADRRSIVFTADDDLIFGETLSLIIPGGTSGITAETGQTLTTDQAFEFVVTDSGDLSCGRPHIVEVDPGFGAEDACTNGIIAIGFDRELDPGSVNDTTIALYRWDTTQPGDGETAAPWYHRWWQVVRGWFRATDLAAATTTPGNGGDIIIEDPGEVLAVAAEDFSPAAFIDSENKRWIRVPATISYNPALFQIEIIPAEELGRDEAYVVLLAGENGLMGDSFIQTPRGVAMRDAVHSGEDFDTLVETDVYFADRDRMWLFETGDRCDLDYIELNLDRHEFTSVPTSWSSPFNFASLELGNRTDEMQVLRATPHTDARGGAIIRPTDNYDWTWSTDIIEQDVLQDFIENPEFSDGFLCGDNEYCVALGADDNNGFDQVIVSATLSSNGRVVSQDALFEVFLCELPWDHQLANAGDVANDNGYNPHATNFKFKYCRDIDVDDDHLSLPALELVPGDEFGGYDMERFGVDCEFVREAGREDLYQQCNEGAYPRILKEFLFVPMPQENDLDTTGVIGVRVEYNDQFLNLSDWYEQRFDTPLSGGQSTLYGYEAATVGRTVYVNTYNWRQDGGLNEVMDNVVFVFTFSDDADENIQNIFNQLLTTLRFNVNWVGGTNEAGQSIPEVGNLEGYQKDLELQTEIETLAGLVRAAGYPQLNAGTFVRGVTTSTWPSWKDTFAASLGATPPVGPVNQFLPACSNDPYESGTCWDEVGFEYVCPGLPGRQYSEVIQYVYDSTQPNLDTEDPDDVGYFNIYTRFEHPEINWDRAGFENYRFAESGQGFAAREASSVVPGEDVSLEKYWYPFACFNYRYNDWGEEQQPEDWTL